MDFRANTPYDENDFLLLRTRVHAGYSPMDWMNVFAEGQNSSSSGDKRNPNQQSDGPFNLRQAYLRLGGATNLPVSVKVGRQELNYGDERLVGSFDWDNIGRTFDAAKLRYEQSHFWVDAFVSRVVLPNDNEFNQANWDDWFSGVYGSTRSLVPRTELQLYFLADMRAAAHRIHVTTYGKGNSPRDIYTIGSRFQTLPGQLNGFDVNGEFAGQFGDFEYAPGTPGVVNGKRLDHLAYATHIEGGYTFAKVDWKPRVALGLDYGSGDGDPSDNKHNTFVNLYPTNHKFYGAMDFLSWQSVLDPYLKASITPVQEPIAGCHLQRLLARFHQRFLLPNQPGSPHRRRIRHPSAKRQFRRPGSRFCGHLPTGGLSLLARPDTVTSSPARYINQTFQNLGGSHDANWAYIQAQFTF